MRIYDTQEQVNVDLIGGNLIINDDITFKCNIVIDGSINAWNINAWNINAWNINAWNIDAENISFYVVCFAYKNIACRSIIGRRENSKYFCLDREVKIRKARS
jgi:hypothetical protein